MAGRGPPPAPPPEPGPGPGRALGSSSLIGHAPARVSRDDHAVGYMTHIDRRDSSGLAQQHQNPPAQSFMSPLSSASFASYPQQQQQQQQQQHHNQHQLRQQVPQSQLAPFGQQHQHQQYFANDSWFMTAQPHNLPTVDALSQQHARLTDEPPALSLSSLSPGSAGTSSVHTYPPGPPFDSRPLSPPDPYFQQRQQEEQQQQQQQQQHQQHQQQQHQQHQQEYVQQQHDYSQRKQQQQQQQQDYTEYPQFFQIDFTNAFSPSNLFPTNDPKLDPVVEKEAGDPLPLPPQPQPQPQHQPEPVESGKRPRARLADSISACWNSPLCPNNRSSSSTPDPSSCGAACAPYLFRDVTPLPPDQPNLPQQSAMPPQSQQSQQQQPLESVPDINAFFPDAGLDGWPSEPATAHSPTATAAGSRGDEKPPAQKQNSVPGIPQARQKLKRDSAQASEGEPQGRTITKTEHLSSPISPTYPKPVSPRTNSAGSGAAAELDAKPETVQDLSEQTPASVPAQTSEPLDSAPTDADSATKTRRRQPHKQVERKYRESLNAQLESLRRVVPALQQNNRFNMNANFVSPATLSTFNGSVTAPCNGDIEDLPPSSLAKPSKAVILATATAYIQNMEKEKETLREENNSLKEKLKAVQELMKCDDCGLLQYVMNLNISNEQKPSLPQVLQQLRHRQQLQHSIISNT